MPIITRKTKALTAQLSAKQDALLQEKARQTSAQQAHIAAAGAAHEAAATASTQSAAIVQALEILEAAGVE